MADSLSNAEKAKEAHREVQMRCRVYPRRVADGKMTQAEADRKIAVMVSIEADYERLAEADRQAATPTLL